MGHPDPARAAAYDTLRLVTDRGAYANLALADVLSERGLTGRDAAFATELLYGTCRHQGSYDKIIAAASGRDDLKPDVTDLLRLGCHQLLSMRVADHAAVSATVDLARSRIGEKVVGLANAVLHRVNAHDLDGWVDLLSDGLSERAALALRTHHPEWIVDAYAEVLPAAELEQALTANNVAPDTALAVRPGLCSVAELAAAGASPGRYSPHAAVAAGDPGDLEAVRQGRAGVQDEGSQLVALAVGRAASAGPSHWWLDLCAGPGGKAALLAGLAAQQGCRLLAAERRPHRAVLVSQALRAYPATGNDVPGSRRVITADGLRPPWRPGAFAKVVADVPCTGLGALRRRPEARWRRSQDELVALTRLQADLLSSALDGVQVGGVVGYITCSPHRAETTDLVDALVRGRCDVTVVPAAGLLAEVTDAARGDYLQLWPHRHGTDAMFLALLRKEVPRPMSADVT